MFVRQILITLVAVVGVSSSPRPWLAHSRSLLARQSNLDLFVIQESSISVAGAVANIGGNNSTLVPGALPGVVVASPSTYNPNYFYTWTRDSALTFMMIIDQVIFGANNSANLTQNINSYIRAQAYLQTVTNPSGSLYPAGLGLGEPKFYTNLTRFNDVWGRPQRDGPALRATALMKWANYLLSQNTTISTNGTNGTTTTNSSSSTNSTSNMSRVLNVIWPIIQNDLRYVGQYWNRTGYDLWEEVQGSSFFTYNAQHRALVMGSLLAAKLNTTCNACAQASNIQCFLQNNFWNATGKYIIANINTNQVTTRSGIDAETLISSAEVFDINATCSASDYQPCSSRMLANHKAVVDSFRTLYPINNNATSGRPILIGRYPEDTYYGGNPWPLCTFAAAEVLFDAIAQFQRNGSLTIDNTSLPFFMDIYPSAKAQTYSGQNMSVILAAMSTYADGFLTAVQPYLVTNGSISEQINKTSGLETSASKLTWSFAAFVTAAQRGQGRYPTSWGAGSATANNATNGTCQSGSYNATGLYMPAVAAGAPNVSLACTTEVIFIANISTTFGTNAFLVGNTTKLGGSLNNRSAIIEPCNPSNYTSTRPEWFVDIYVPAGQTIQYQWVLQQANGTFTFENRTRTITPAVCGNTTVVMTNDAPSFPM